MNNQLIASDNFVSGSLAAGWAVLPGSLKCQVIAGSPNVTEPNTASTLAGQIWTGTVFPTDQSSEITINALTTEANTYAILLVRTSGTSTANGYICYLSNGNAYIYRLDAGGAVALQSNPTNPVVATIAAGDIWTLQAAGSVISLYQNGALVMWGEDATYKTGSPGFAQQSGTITHTKVASWSGYSAVQQDGIWAKQSIILAPQSNEFINGINNVDIIYEGNAQILSGTVYKMWVGTGITANPLSVAYFESADGIAWTRYTGTTNGYVITDGGQCISVIKVSGTYHLYCNTPSAKPIQHYTSSDGIAWTKQSANVFTVGGAGTWDANTIFYFSVITVIAGTWYALYTGLNNVAIATGLATSSDGITWTRYVSNPVATNFWGIVRPLLRNGVWYAWGQTCNPGQGSNKDTVDPGEGLRMQTVDFITWTNPVHSLHHSQMYEGLNGVNGGCFVSFPLNVGGKAYMYSTSVMDDVDASASVVGGYQITLAIGPAVIESIITANEDALSQVASDAFQRANENPLSGGGNWSSISGEGNLKILSNKVEASTNAGSAMAFTGGVFANDQYSSVTIGVLGANGYAFPIVRAATGANTFYYATVHGATNSAGTVSLQKLVAGAGTQLGPAVGYTPQSGDVFTLSIIGNVLSLYQNGYLIVQAQDPASSIASGSPGMGMNPVSATLTNALITAWAGGNANVIPTYPSLGSGLVMAGGDSADDEEDEGF